MQLAAAFPEQPRAFCESPPGASMAHLALPVGLEYVATSSFGPVAPTTLSSCPLPLHRWGSPWLSMQLVDAAIRPIRSVWLRSAPVSTRPTSTPVPIDRVHAVGAPIRPSPHCCVASGSFETAAMASGAAA